MQPPSVASLTRRPCLHPEAVLSVLMLFLNIVTLSRQCSSSCIRPQPMPPPLALGETDLNTALVAQRCEMACIKDHAPDAELINENTPWPTYADFEFTDNCGLFNKIQGCKQGCMEHFAIPELTVNRCRDSCFDKCRNSEDESRTAGQCPQDCRKTYCRFGCLLYESISSNNNGASNQPLTALVGPSVVSLQTTNTCSRWQHEVTIGLPSSGNDSNLTSNTAERAQQQNPVTFLLKVSSQNGGIVRYIWQKSLSMSLDLASFACQQVSLSHAVITANTSISRLVFSPQTSVCISGLSAYPSQVNQTTINVEFSEDTRDGFFGYSVANLSWQRSQDHDCASSYQVNVYPDRLECGGIDEREQPGIKFLNINRTLTSFIFRAKVANGFMKFGCSYIFEVETLPVPSIQIGPRITRLTELTNTPSMEVQCSRIWGEDGHFNVSVSIVLSQSESTSHINRFRLSPTLQRNRQLVQTLGEDVLIPQANRSEFVKVLSTWFMPREDNSHAVNIMIRAEKDRTYFWRSIPHAKGCSVSMDPIPPESIKNILVENILHTPSSETLTFDLSWTPPVAYGELKDYELMVLNIDDRNRLVRGTSIESLQPYFRQTLIAESTKTVVNASVQVSSSRHCLYLVMRARNNFTLFSTWSSSIVLPLDGHCIVQPPSLDPLTNVTSMPTDTFPNSKISVFYEADDGSKVRLLDVGCEANPGSTEQNIHNRLNGIESRVDAVLSQLNAEHEAFERLSHLQAKLNNIEQKLDSLMALVTTHVYGHET